MARFTIVLAFLVALACIQLNVAKPYLEEVPSKEDLSMTILNAKNRAFDQVQSIKTLASIKTDKFIKTVNEIVEKAWLYMETLKKKSDNANPMCENKAKDDINGYALKTISTYENCVLKVVDYVDWEMQSMSFDASILIKDIDAAKSVDEELRRRTAEFETRSFQFGQYMNKLEKCDTQSNIPRLKRQISEVMTSYTQCLKN